MKRGEIFFENQLAGIISETEEGYTFDYNDEYLTSDLPSISLSMPKSVKTYNSSTLFPFFDGLIPEGWLLNIATKNWKINTRDRMELLLTCCEDTIGAASVRRVL